ncbi:transcriptional regulator with XRE-family HTH domain [Streptomyces sp. LBL]|uniref:helix-turn-helix domain-containing protein n=1 Tax=Streptomyces sp. LBL TaxID=2940562 RepID=UPI00247387B3|nr:helix-turn-helix transcriptional regulator [Streptomyces sp. LBL]MDH6625964.1 transcriptional regulator with XRE-family HTH domain [Streptomyces sp. LBL]
MSRDAHLSELGEFLTARRAELSPRAMGLPESGALRRVPGLRREEVAQLAAISTVYYTRLEQGRIEASARVLTALARVFRLDDDQRDYMLELAGKEKTRPRRNSVQKVRPSTQRLLDNLTDTPAIVLGRCMDILAWNNLAAALLTDFSQVPEGQRNSARMLFTDPAMRELYADWETVARTVVAFLRMEAADNPDDPRMAALVEELSEKDPQFREWWAAHHVAHHSMGTKTFRHPVAGGLTLDWETLACPTDPDQHLVIWTAEPGTASHEGLRVLACWAANHHPRADTAG